MTTSSCFVTYGQQAASSMPAFCRVLRPVDRLHPDCLYDLAQALPFIENLEMEQCGATWVGLRALGTADESKLTSLSANSNNLDGLQLDGCSALRGLTIIDLSYGNLTASGCPLLCDGLVALAHLARVDVSYNVLREGCQEFARLVPACTQLFVLAMCDPSCVDCPVAAAGSLHTVCCAYPVAHRNAHGNHACFSPFRFGYLTAVGDPSPQFTPCHRRFQGNKSGWTMQADRRWRGRPVPRGGT